MQRSQTIIQSPNGIIHQHFNRNLNTFYKTLFPFHFLISFHIMIRSLLLTLPNQNSPSNCLHNKLKYQEEKHHSLNPRLRSKVSNQVIIPIGNLIIKPQKQTYSQTYNSCYKIKGTSSYGPCMPYPLLEVLMDIVGYIDSLF